MKRNKRKKRILVGLEDADLREAKANAKANGLNLSEFIRRRVNGRPLKAVKRRYKSQEEGSEAPEGHTAAFEIAMGRKPSSEAEYLEWFLEQDVSEEMQAALERSDERMARAEAERARFAANREREGKRTRLLPAEVMPQAASAVVPKEPTLREQQQSNDRARIAELGNGMILD